MLYFFLDLTSFHFLPPIPLICLGPTVTYQCHYYPLFSCNIKW